MPFLNIRSANLHFQGPTIEVIIVPPRPVIANLQKQNKSAPSFKALALIDTGATGTMITQAIVDALGLSPFDVREIGTAGGKSRQMMYDAGVVLPISMNNAFAVQASCGDLSGQPYQVLIGRDILRSCALYYNGIENSYTLHF